MRALWQGTGDVVRRRTERVLGRAFTRRADTTPDVIVLHVLRYRGAAVRELAALAARAPVVLLVRDWDLDEARAACRAGARACLEASAAPDMLADVISEVAALAGASASEAACRPSSRQAAA